ncbi:3alpha(or 20beta)-hydroxysteroid dehydrogenase [Sphingobium xenophagum]|uniref:3alpha(Or 20beta)-hydroxysteroid dehydrogenase n=1 Tax=Sphingobium xenophagum TaxID=121428 RepID=A0ABU1X530_SPHXE|nr:SDR family oxidoreductase [Sphingobium xenophagum]MDR7156694.1 3alpha(or 20beta)-hydroxysteroid dehydrogenase [Sphingobium xenophagum]
MKGKTTMSQLNERVIVVTGGAGGMGLAIARALKERGARVIATDLREPQDPIDGVEFARHDITSERDWDTVIASAIDRFGRLDGLVNNAGWGELAPFQQTETEMFEKTLRVNQIGTFLGMKKAAEAMKDKGGAIVNIASCVSMRGVAGQFAYSTSKWAVRGMTKCAALDLAAHGIRVNSVNPGPTDTPMIAAFPGEMRAAVQSMIPMGRFGDPREIAATTAFLLSDDASYITGAEVEVDGGFFA